MYTRNLLFSLYRGVFEEIAVHGEILVADDEKVVFQTSEVTGAYPIRSLLKPFQFLATGLPSKKLKEFPIEMSAACVGSISANEAQVKQLEEWYGDAHFKGLREKLQLPPSFPMDERARVHAKDKAIGPQTVFHTCFSKHMAILRGCEENGWPLEDYHSIYHPFHARLISSLESLLGENLKQAISVPDGCLLPTPGLSLFQMARLYQKLAIAPEENALGQIRTIMMKRPEWVGGPKRIDTLLMEKNPGKVVAKEGADGLLGLGILPSTKYPKGLGIIIKLGIGYHPNFAALGLVPILEHLGLNPVHEEPRGHEVRFQYKPFTGLRADIMDISPRIGPSTAVWPGDIAYSSKKSLNTLNGDNLTLSSITTTVHIGAHTDAPNHFEKCKVGIDEVVLEKYTGPVQVISVLKAPSSQIMPADISHISIKARRVLFKTDSFPLPNEFSKDFVSLSREVVDYLASRGVVLVGIDTPSIDLFESKDLPAHHATAKHSMAVLEGICFDSVESGVYELIALPLKLEGADASPVRAVLRPI